MNVHKSYVGTLVAAREDDGSGGGQRSSFAHQRSYSCGDISPTDTDPRDDDPADADSVGVDRQQAPDHDDNRRRRHAGSGRETAAVMDSVAAANGQLDHLTVMPNSHRSPDTSQACELTAGQVRSASECVRRSYCAARHTADTDQTQNAAVWRSGRLSSHRHTRHDKTVQSVSCLVCRCKLALLQGCSCRYWHCPHSMRNKSMKRYGVCSSVCLSVPFVRCSSVRRVCCCQPDR